MKLIIINLMKQTLFELNGIKHWNVEMTSHSSWDKCQMRLERLKIHNSIYNHRLIELNSNVWQKNVILSVHLSHFYFFILLRIFFCDNFLSSIQKGKGRGRVKYTVLVKLFFSYNITVYHKIMYIIIRS